MADHVREQIAVAALAAVTGLTTTGARVFRDRDTDENPLKDNEVPGLVVLDGGDPSELVTLGVHGLLERTMTLQFVAHVKASSGYQSELNKILKEIEVVLEVSPLGGAKWALLTGVSEREQSEAGEKPAVRQTFSFEFFYVTERGVPDVAL